MHSVRSISFGLALTLGLTSCSREAYREAADRDAYATALAASAGTPWELPAGFHIEPSPSSRLHDASAPDFPELPDPRPRLYSHELPEGIGRSRTVAIEERIDTTSPAPPETEATNEAQRTHPIPRPYWDALSDDCLARMLAFESVRAEYESAFEEAPPEDLLGDRRLLDFDDIVQLALLDSREYQAQKEALYSTALAAAQARYQYSPRLSPTDTGGTAEYANERSGGTSQQTASFRPSAQIEALLVSGGQLVARFANEVVLTFGGPEGFSRDVGSELLFGFTQSLLQSDVRLEPLVQAERDVVYAARDLARFRRGFFVELAAQYYGLLRTYRGIEIESQNYFSLVRTFERAQAEVRSNVQNAPNPVAVDQFEQGMLSGRSSLISSCDALERSLDALKILIGLPTEMQVDLDLGELARLTLLDEVGVAAERVERWLVRVEYRSGQESPDAAEVLSASGFLIERLLECLELRRELGDTAEVDEQLESWLESLERQQAELEVSRLEAELQATRAGERAPRILVYERLDDLLEARLLLADLQLAELENRPPDRAVDAEHRAPEGDAIAGLRARFDTLRETIPEILQHPQQEGLPELLANAELLNGELVAISSSLEERLPDDESSEDTDETAARIVDLARATIASWELGLPALDLDMDEAMATALVQRLDLMNSRGRLADDRRAIKLAADDLRSLLDLDVSYNLRTRDGKPFAFSARESSLRAALRIDLPFERRTQRDTYRRSLIEFQAGRRDLMALEDSIKLEIRNGLRDLEVTRIQYPISVQQAALAAEQVISVRLQLALGIEGVRGTDLLDALQSSRQALIAVADNRLSWIVERARLVHALEQLALDERGHWRRLDDPSFQPIPMQSYPTSAGPAFGSLPEGLWLSDEVRATESDGPLPQDRAGP